MHSWLLGGEPATPQGGWHGEVERQYGIPERVGHIIDSTFEHLKAPAHAAFAVEVIDAIPVGADLSLVADTLWLEALTDSEVGVYAQDLTTEARAAVDGVIAIVRRAAAGEDVPRSEWWASAAACDRAAEDASDTPAWPFMDSAATLAGEATDADSMEHVTAEWTAARLIRHLSAAPVPEATNA
jgi:hypothetical protein